jgi:NADPH-dependent 2,4-dienoyl-CoA reductase/sulfur reductase-like enzyme
MNTASHYQVLIIGGGTAGITVAASLRRRQGARQQAQLLPPGVQWIQDKAAAFDPDNNTVELASGTTRQQELALVVSTPQRVWTEGYTELCTLGLVALACATRNQAMSIKDCVDGVGGRWFDHRKLFNQLVTDLGCTPGLGFPLDLQDGLLDWKGVLFGCR